MKGLKIASRILKSVALGVADNVPIVNSIKTNIQSELGGQGKFDYIRLATALGTIAIIAAFLLGSITMEEVEKLLKLI